MVPIAKVEVKLISEIYTKATVLIDQSKEIDDFLKINVWAIWVSNYSSNIK